MGRLIITRGVPASGKSTFAKAFVAEEPEHRVRVNRDDLRFQMFNSYWGPEVDERAVTVAQQALLRAFLPRRDVVLDNTNLKAKDVKETLKLARSVGAEVEFEDFPISYEEAVARDELRFMHGHRAVGAEVIKIFFDRFLKKDGTLPPIPVLDDPVADYEFKPYVRGGIKAASFDLDGTLAHMNGRSPYDPTLYHTDTVDEHVREALWHYWENDHDIIILTARDDTYRSAVEEWLADNSIPYDTLLMRSGGDSRNDAIVKSEIVDEHISGTYDIRMHFDDRNRVVDALRAKGIKVAQVNPGDF